MDSNWQAGTHADGMQACSKLLDEARLSYIVWDELGSECPDADMFHLSLSSVIYCVLTLISPQIFLLSGRSKGHACMQSLRRTRAVKKTSHGSLQSSSAQLGIAKVIPKCHNCIVQHLQCALRVVGMRGMSGVKSLHVEGTQTGHRPSHLLGQTGDRAVAEPPRMAQQQGGPSQQPSISEVADRLLPLANVAKLMKQVLPENAKIAKDAKETVQECVSEFISFVTSECVVWSLKDTSRRFFACG